MIESTKARTANPAASPAQPTTPKVDSAEMPAAAHEFAESGIAQATSSLKNAKAATEVAADGLQQAYSVAVKGAADYNLKVFEIARANTHAAFDYAEELLGVRSLSQFVELSSARTRTQMEAMSAQTKELAALAQKVSSETAGPLKTGITGVFNKVS